MAKEVSKETMEFIRQMKAADTAKAARPAAPKPSPAPLPIDKVWDSLDESQRTHKVVFQEEKAPAKKNKSWPSNPLRWGKPVALAVLTLSTLVFFRSLYADVSVDTDTGRINNIGLIANQQVTVLGSGILMAMSFFYMVASTALSVVLQALEMTCNKESSK